MPLQCDICMRPRYTQVPSGIFHSANPSGTVKYAAHNYSPILPFGRHTSEWHAHQHPALLETFDAEHVCWGWRCDDWFHRLAMHMRGLWQVPRPVCTVTALDIASYARLLLPYAGIGAAAIAS